MIQDKPLYRPFADTNKRRWQGRLAHTAEEALALAYALKCRIARTRQELILIGVTRVEKEKAK